VVGAEALLLERQRLPQVLERLGVSPTVSAVEVLGAVVEQESVFSGITERLSLASGKVSILEVRLPHDAPAVGRTLSQLALPDGATALDAARAIEPMMREAWQIFSEMFPDPDIDADFALLTQLTGNIQRSCFEPVPLVVDVPFSCGYI